MNPVVFSIVMPAYNRGSLIKASIQSVLDQTFKRFELIVVDDGSEDDTRDVVQGFSDERIRYYYKCNEERSIARNFGIDKASGRYVTFLDSDDYFYQNHLETAYRNLEKMDFPELLHLGFEIRDSKHNTILKTVDLKNFSNEQLIFENVLTGNSFFIRNEIIREIRFLHDRNAIVSEDWFLWLRLAARYKVHCVSEITNVVIEHEERSLRKMKAKKVEASILSIISALKQDGEFLKFYQAGIPYFFSECYSLISLHYIDTSRVKSFKYFLIALGIHPQFVFRKRFWAIVKNLVLGLNGNLKETTI